MHNSPARFLVLVKGSGERFLFVYDDVPESRAELLNAMGRMAADADCNFTWRDAAILSQRVKAVG